MPRLAAIGVGAVLVVALGGWSFSRWPGSVSPNDGGKVAALHVTQASARSTFSSIILPDLLVVMPHGLTGAKVARMRAIKGVIKLITFDGAQITVSGQPASVIGVNPSQFRSWVPLRTASDKQLWTHLAAGQFIAATSSAARLRLVKASAYRLAGTASFRVTFGGAGRLDVAGVDLVVDQAISRRLGLVHQVAALLSAPGPSIATLTAKVRRVLGVGARLVVLRNQQQAAIPVTASQITNYLQLFQVSSAKYCPSLSWTVLAAIGQIESGDGRNVGPSTAGALGPMQFLPSTWAEWGIDGFGPVGPPDVMNPFDAVPSAARLLCAAGALTGTQAGLRQAIFAYNHADWYVNEVLSLAAQYAAQYR
jgi:Transglycosylase SLT domain